MTGTSFLPVASARPFLVPLLVSLPRSALGVRQIEDTVDQAPTTPKPSEITPQHNLDALQQQVMSSGEASDELLAQMRVLWNQGLYVKSEVQELLKQMWRKVAAKEAEAWFAKQEQEWDLGSCTAKVVEEAKKDLHDGKTVGELCAMSNRFHHLRDEIPYGEDGYITCLPEVEEYVPDEVEVYTPDYYHWEIVKDAAQDLLGEAAVQELCGKDKHLGEAPWDQACAKEPYYWFMGARHVDRIREENCGLKGVSEPLKVSMAKRYREEPKEFTDMLGKEAVCLKKASAINFLSEADQDVQITNLVMAVLDIFCNVQQPDAECKEAPDQAVEECGNALLAAHHPQKNTHLVDHFCQNVASKDFAASPDSSHIKFMSHLLNKKFRNGFLTTYYNLPFICTQSNGLLARAALAAFQCGCPWNMEGGQPPVVKPPVRFKVNESEMLRLRAVHWKDLGHPNGTSADGKMLVNSIATLAEERPASVNAILQLAHYPDYANGPVASLDWDQHHDVRFRPSSTSASFSPHQSTSNPTTLRVYRFAMDKWEYKLRLGNTNAGDLAHVCGWGSSVTDGMREGEADYSLFVYTIETAGARGPYHKCNDESCGSSKKLGHTFKDMGKKEIGCYHGQAAWYSLPNTNDTDWKVESLDRVISWKCARDLGLFKQKRKELVMFSAIDKILFTLDGCHTCPDVLEPDDTPRRVCPRA